MPRITEALTRGRPRHPVRGAASSLAAGNGPRGMLPPEEEGDENPFAADNQAAVERGAVMFNTYCVPCHGTKGEGDGLVVQHGYPAPPSLSSPGTRSMSDADIYAAITNGLGGMPSYGGQMARDDWWKAILHLRKLQEAAPAEAAPAEAAPAEAAR